MKTGDILKVKIIDDNHLGNGIAKKDNITIFVPKTVKDDLVEIQITDVKKNICFAKVLTILEKSNNHLTAECPYYDECGGCDLLHVSYDREKDLKEKYIKRIFGYDTKIKSFSRGKYRNKVTLHIKNNCLGYYEKNSNTLIPIDKCLLLTDNINKTIDLLKGINLSNITEIVIKDASGILISIYGSISDNDISLLKKGAKSIYLNNRLIYGDEYLNIKFNDLNYNINNNSFFQINNDCAEELYSKIKEIVGKCDRLLDLYCGTGSIGLFLHENAKFITGVEINRDSVRCAKKNIKDNNISNYRIINADASCVNNSFDAIIVDPPRSGLSEDVINILNKMKTSKLIYVSCNPSTLKRDISLLKSYMLEDLWTFNMFPATGHIECLSLFSLRGD